MSQEQELVVDVENRILLKDISRLEDFVYGDESPAAKKSKKILKGGKKSKKK